jgi:hypothetical protein
MILSHFPRPPLSTSSQFSLSPCFTDSALLVNVLQETSPPKLCKNYSRIVAPSLHRQVCGGWALMCADVKMVTDELGCYSRFHLFIYLFIFLNSLVLHPYLCLLSWPSCILPFSFSLYLQQLTQISIPPAGFFFFALSVLHLYVFVLIVLALPFILYCTTHTTQTSMPPEGFEPAIPAIKRLQTYALNRMTTGIGEVESSVVLYTTQ